MTADIERLAKAICGNDLAPSRYEHALAIAESEFVLRNVRAARLAVIERTTTTIAGALERIPGLPGDDQWDRALDTLAHGEPGPATRLFIRAAQAVRDFAGKLATADAGKDTTNQDDAAGRVNEPHSAPKHPVGAYGDAAVGGPQSPSGPNIEALRDALPELISLDRYEQRALSRQRRAIRHLVAAAALSAADGSESKAVRTSSAGPCSL